MARVNAYTNQEAHANRQDALASLKDLNEIQSMTRERLTSLIGLFGFGQVFGCIEIPRNYMPAGKRQNPNARTFDFREVAGGRENVLLAIMRVVCLRWLAPIATATEPATASTFGNTLASLRRVCSLLSNVPADSAQVWSRITYDDMASVVSGRSLEDISTVFRSLAERKLLCDTVRLPERGWPGQLERSRKNQPEPTSTTKKKKEPFLALPDALVSAFGWRCVWLIRDLGPMLLEVMESIYKSRKVRSDLTRNEAIRDFNLAARDRLEKRRWLTAQAQPLSVPFELHIKTRNRKRSGELSSTMVWPPDTLANLWQLAAILQGAHIFVVALSGGPRAGELLSLQRSALKTVRGKTRVEGRTYKLVFQEQGKERDWPAPELTLTAVTQQVRLSDLTRLAAKRYGNVIEGDHLWAQPPSQDYEFTGQPLHDFDPILNKMVRVFNLGHLLDNSSTRTRRLHPHRIRKSTGRLVGLSLTNGLHALMDLFGHQDPEMTVAYLLSNPDIAEEARDVAKAQTIMFATDAITQVDTRSGKAAAHVKQAAVDFARLRGKTKLDAAGVDELARDLTENGRYWELVRPGVLCTKLPGQVGRCNGSIASPDSSRCQAGCGHRLELASQQENVHRTIARLVEHLDRAIADDEPMLAEQWRGQILANLSRFDAVKARWLLHPRIAELLAPLASGRPRG